MGVVDREVLRGAFALVAPKYLDRREIDDT
jgi:hypothetical protein